MPDTLAFVEFIGDVMLLTFLIGGLAIFLYWWGRNP